MANLYKNKIIYGGNVLIDLTDDDVAENKVLIGTKFHKPSGEQVTASAQNGGIPSKGAETYVPGTTDKTITANQYLSGAQTVKGDADLIAANIKSGVTLFDGTAGAIVGTFTNDATASASEILTGKTAYNSGSKLTGTMANNGAVSGSISTKAGQYTVPAGYHDGSGKVSIASAEQAKIIPSNIKSGINILGVVGEYSGEGATAEAITVTPYTTAKDYNPSAGVDYISSVHVNAIAYTETDNDAGGVTVSIGTVDPAA